MTGRRVGAEPAAGAAAAPAEPAALPAARRGRGASPRRGARRQRRHEVQVRQPSAAEMRKTNCFYM